MDVVTTPDELIREERFETEEQEAQEPKNTDKDSSIFKQYMARRKLMDAQWGEIHLEMRVDWDIYMLNQWTNDAKTKRKGRPMVTCDITRKFVKAVISSTQSSPPGVKLTGRNENARLKSQAIGEAIRFFEDISGAQYAYTWAQECSAVGGIGFVKTYYEISKNQSLPMVVGVSRIEDPFSVLLDPDSIQLDGSDAIDCVEIHAPTKRAKSGKEHKQKVTYWYKDDAQNLVKWAIIEGDQIESKGIWAGHNIPITPVYGELFSIGGKRTLFGVVRQIRDYQRTFNFTTSEMIERTAMAPKSTWLVDDRTPQSYIDNMVQSLANPTPVIKYKSSIKGSDGQDITINTPTRNNDAPDVSWVTPMLTNILQGAKETTGIYDSSLGNESQELSGVAIKARSANSDRGQLVYSEHLQISLKGVGFNMLDLMEAVIEPVGVLPGRKEDGTVTAYQIGGEVEGMTEGQGQFGGVISDFSPLDLDISVSSGKAYATRKEEGFDKLVELLKLDPASAPKVMDLVVDGMDFPGGDGIAKRLAPVGAGMDEGGIDPAIAMQQQEQSNATIAELQAQLEKLQNDNTQLAMTIQQNTALELQKETIKSQTNLAIKQMEIDAQLRQTAIKEAGQNDRLVAQIIADANQQNQNTALDLVKQISGVTYNKQSGALA